MLLTDDADPLPKTLDGYFLDVQPGYEGDPRDGVYNHVWILGDTKTMSPGVQGRIDEVSALVPVEYPRRVAFPGISEYERPDRYTREPTMEDLRQLFGASRRTSRCSCATGSAG